MNISEIALYCSVPSPDQCLGICPNPGIAGIGTRVATFAQAIISGYSMIWLPDEFDRRKTYYIQHLSTFSLVLLGFLYGGILADRTVTSYHALLIAYLSFGNAANGAVPFYTYIFFHRISSLGVFFMSYMLFAGLVITLAIDATTKVGFGSQSVCNPQLIQGAWHAPVGVLFSLLGVFPWVFGLLYAFVRRCVARDQASMYTALKHPSAVPTHRIYWSVILSAYYTAWIFITEKYIYSQTLPVLSKSEMTFSQSQVQSVSLAVITAFFPLRAVFYGLVYRPPTHSAWRGEHIRLPSRDSAMDF